MTRAVKVWVLICSIAISAISAQAQDQSTGQSDANGSAKRPYTISKETTYFTGPLKPDGSIDFLAAVNEHFARGVTPQNNAARIIVPLIGWDEGESAVEVAQLLQSLDQRKSDSALFPPDSSRLKVALSADELQRQFRHAQSNLWRTDEFPAISKWLTENNQVLNQVSAATHLERFFVPRIAGRETELLLLISQPHLDGLRTFSRAFAVRSNGRVAIGRWADAWSEILAMQRLGRLAGQGQSALDSLVATSIITSACDCAKRLIESPETVVEWQAYYDSWDASSFLNLERAMDVTERVQALEIMCAFFERPDRLEGLMSSLRGPTEPDDAGITKLIWDTMRTMVDEGEVSADKVLRHANKTFDEMISAARQNELAKRRKTMDQFGRNIERFGFFPVRSSQATKSPRCLNRCWFRRCRAST